MRTVQIKKRSKIVNSTPAGTDSAVWLLNTRNSFFFFFVALSALDVELPQLKGAHPWAICRIFYSNSERAWGTMCLRVKFSRKLGKTCSETFQLLFKHTIVTFYYQLIVLNICDVTVHVEIICLTKICEDIDVFPVQYLSSCPVNVASPTSWSSLSCPNMPECPQT